MEFEVGKLYKSKESALIVKCISINSFSDTYFCAEVVVSDGFLSIERKANEFLKSMFVSCEEVTKYYKLRADKLRKEKRI